MKESNLKFKFYLDNPEPVRSCLLALRSMILEHDPNITETQKYKMPCFCYKNKIFCYLWIDKKTEEPYLLWVEGKHLTHSKLETGTRTRMKILRVNPNRNIPVQNITAILKKAIALYQTGIVKMEK
ncbi:MAG TPA: DUF1801 domain-containing protein [Bacteroidia bacterium]|nr:DUF1801 domain-containing protein [Bacteroidia bacterium]